MRYDRANKFLGNLGLDINSLQENIKDKKLVIVGCGGIGSVLSELLVRMGFLNLVLVDFDKIDESNLGRQVFLEEDIGNLKAQALSEYLLKIDTSGNFEVVCDKLTKKNISKLCNNCNLIVDCCDNFDTRVLINDFCEQNLVDWVYNGAVKSEFVSCLFYGKDKLFNKVFPKEVYGDDNCDVGVLASSVFGGASLALNGILKYFMGIRENKMIKIDMWQGNLFEIKLK